MNVEQKAIIEVAEKAVERLEVEGVISEEDEMGGREILQAA